MHQCAGSPDDAPQRHPSECTSHRGALAHCPGNQANVASLPLATRNRSWQLGRACLMVFDIGNGRYIKNLGSDDCNISCYPTMHGRHLWPAVACSIMVTKHTSRILSVTQRSARNCCIAEQVYICLRLKPPSGYAMRFFLFIKNMLILPRKSQFLLRNACNLVDIFLCFFMHLSIIWMLYHTN